MKVFTLIMSSLLVLVACTSIASQGNRGIQNDRNTKPKHHIDNGFQNHPFVETAAPKGFMFYMRRFWGSVFTPDIPEGHALSEEDSIKLLNSIDGDKISWLGHASFLIETSGVRIATDPFLTEFASPLSWAGPRRYVESGIGLKNLQKLDVVIISHSHYDHLDEGTINALRNKEQIHVIVPLGLKSFFTERGYTHVTELDWNGSVSVKNVKITSLPSVHDSARSTSDHNQTLWSSWAINGPEQNILFIGDTGYSESIFPNIEPERKPRSARVLSFRI